MAKAPRSRNMAERLADGGPPLAALAGGAAAAGASFVLTPAGLAGALLFGAVAAAGLHGSVSAWRFRGEKRRLMDAQRLLLDEVLALRGRLSDAEAKLSAPERDGAASATALWRGVASDIDVLGSLMRDVARAVADHEARLTGLAEREPPAATQPPAVAASRPAPPDHPSDTARQRSRPMDDAGGSPQLPGALQRVPPLDRSRMRATLSEALASELLELCLQPVVSLPQRRTVGYRASLRLKPGEAASRDAEIAASGDLRRLALLAESSFDHDMKLIQRALQVLRVLRARNRLVTITCRIARATLASPAFVPDLRLSCSGDAQLAGGLRLELAAFDMTAMGALDQDVVRALLALGPRLAVADVGGFRVDPAALAANGVVQAEIAADLLTGARQDPRQDVSREDLAGHFARSGIQVLASGVADESMVPELIDLDIAMAAGPVFGDARPVRAEVLEPKPVDAAPPPPAEPAPDQPQRQSFRSLLRRA